MATAVLTLVDTTVPEEAPLAPAEEQSFTAIAYSALQRASCPEMQFTEEWLSAEECVLLPH